MGELGAGSTRWWRFGGIAIGGLLLLSIPECPSEIPSGAVSESFRWDAAVVADLERRFRSARDQGCEETREGLAEARREYVRALADLPAVPGPGASQWNALEGAYFHWAALSAACPSTTVDLLEQGERLRRIVKERTRAWDLADTRSRRQLYRTLYGVRAALEEYLLQCDPADVPALSRGSEEPSTAPSAVVRGVRIHSGDLLVSRGGAPTSALIARGSDYPGNFSHVALVHVDDEGTPRAIEAHIESGVGVTSLDAYLRDRKLRVLVLRLRADLATGDPPLPHRAATTALEQAQRAHIPYDFAMDYRDPSKQFCSEVASHAYREHGIDLWEGLTKMSEGAVVAWLSGFGVERFETHGPSDLEYDPKLVVVAEWRNRDALYRDHVDAAVIDALLSRASPHRRLPYDWWWLVPFRLAKLYSSVLNVFGAVGPVPEGMSATTALRVSRLRDMHEAVRIGLERAAQRFEDEHGYRPPYWELIRLAEEAAARLDLP